MTKQLHICIIDDEQIVCDRLRPILEKKGFSVDTFTDSTIAAEKLAVRNYDILITDIKMPGIDGLELMAHVKTRSPETKVIIITGFATAETASEAIKGGAAEFISKPFRLSKLKELVLQLASEIQKKQETEQE